VTPACPQGLTFSNGFSGNIAYASVSKVASTEKNIISEAGKVLAKI